MLFRRENPESARRGNILSEIYKPIYLECQFPVKIVILSSSSHFHPLMPCNNSEIEPDTHIGLLIDIIEVFWYSNLNKNEQERIWPMTSPSLPLVSKTMSKAYYYASSMDVFLPCSGASIDLQPSSHIRAEPPL